MRDSITLWVWLSPSIGYALSSSDVGYSLDYINKFKVVCTKYEVENYSTLPELAEYLYYRALKQQYDNTIKEWFE